MKLLIPTFLLGAIIGALGVYLVGQSSPEGEVAGDSGLEGKAAERRKEVSRQASEPRRFTPSAEGPDTASKLPRVEVDRDRSKVVVQSPNKVDMQAFRKSMLAAEKERSAKRVNAKLAMLVERLGLDATQAAKVRALLEKQEATKGSLARLIELAGDEGDGGEVSGGEALSIVASLTGEGSAPDIDFEEEMRALLHDDQLVAYDEYEAEQRANQVEIQANQQLTKLQRMLDLTPAQKDEAYQAFARIAEEEVRNPWTGSPNMDVFQRKSQRRQEAMAGILTPEQMEVYESTMGRKGITINALGDGAGVIRMETRVLEVAPDGEE